MIGACIGAFVAWYLFYYLDDSIGGHHSPLMPFQCFWREVMLNIPGGIKRKAHYIKELIGDEIVGAIVGPSLIVWHFDEIRRHNLYEACARDVLPSSGEFWLAACGIPIIGAIVGLGIQVLLLFRG